MLFIVTSSKVEELLTTTVHIRKILEHFEILDEWYHRDKPSRLFDCIQIIWVALEIDQLRWWL